MYPAVGRLIFASCPGLALQTGSHLFDSPRPCPQSRLGSRPVRASHNDLEGWPPHPIRFTTWQFSVGYVVRSSLLLISASRSDLVKGFCRRGDRALQECNPSTRFARRLQVTQAPVPRCGIGFFPCFCKHGPKRKTHRSFSTKSRLFFFYDAVAAPACCWV